MKRFLPPIDFYKYKGKIKEVDLNQAKARLVESEELGKTFLLVYLNSESTATELTRELEKVFENSYRQKTYRILCELVKLGVVRFTKYSTINLENPTEDEKRIIHKHRMFLGSLENPWGNKYEHTVYYSISEKGCEILEFIAKKYKFNIMEE